MLDQLVELKKEAMVDEGKNDEEVAWYFAEMKRQLATVDEEEEEDMVDEQKKVKEEKKVDEQKKEKEEKKEKKEEDDCESVGVQHVPCLLPRWQFK